jgi:Wax ester synthase-like Acyl-CoA acyltransferase domain
METPTTFGHVTGLMIFERPNPDYDPYAAVYAKYASLVGQLEPLRRRLVGVPFGLDHPYWVADPNFDLDFHVREIHLAGPAWSINSPSRSAGSSAGRWTAPGRCGRSTSSTACTAVDGHC